MTQSIPLKNVREQLSELVSRVAYGDQKVVITKFGKPVAALVNFDDYEKIINPAKRFTKEEWESGFEFIDKARKASINVSNRKSQRMIAAAIREVGKNKNVQSSS